MQTHPELFACQANPRVKEHEESPDQEVKMDDVSLSRNASPRYAAT